MGSNPQAVLSPTLNPGTTRAVLVWGAMPRDLDSYLLAASQVYTWFTPGLHLVYACAAGPRLAASQVGYCHFTPGL